MILETKDWTPGGDLRRFLWAAGTLGINTWVETALTERWSLRDLGPVSWLADAEMILSHAQRVCEMRRRARDKTTAWAPVLVFVSETGPLSRYADLVSRGETENVKVVPVSRDGIMRSEMGRWEPSRSERDGDRDSETGERDG